MGRSPKTSAETESDIPVDNWVERYTPVSLHPYIRLARYDRPIGTWLLLFPCWWSIALCYENHDDLWLFITFGFGAIVMRGAGCTLNDILDRNIDAQVARTKDRPLPSGQITVTRAALFLLVQLIIGLFVLLSLKMFSWIIGAAALLLVFTYPLMKRITFWPQLFLGFTFNWGALLGWAAVRGEINEQALWLYAGGVFWTLGYDTIYAHQDRADDLKVGVKSTARKFGLSSKPWLFGFYSLALIMFFLAGFSLNLNWLFYLGLWVASFQLFWQIWSVDIHSPNDCLRKFQSNKIFGWLFLAGIFASRIS
ncbi:MAG: 4-hydroxybenzoate octaprenyltransferase [Pseudomonadota bacterium]|nr:4-hydroxybenzoate octaprenyltransferase [Pseudomonadota bacterium]